jgi:hypothetical protein
MNPQIKHRYTGVILFEGEAGMTTRQMLEKATTSKANLGGADLYGAYLGGADLYGAYLYDADLGGADLYGANLRGAYLYGANLYAADLRGADLRGANLYGANVGGANLYDANLGGANLRDANLRDANLGEKFGKLIAGRSFFQCGPIGSRSDYLQSFITDKGIVIKAGCITGFLDEFSAAVEKTHGDSDHGKEYAMAILMIEAHAAIWTPKEAA